MSYEMQKSVIIEKLQNQLNSAIKQDDPEIRNLEIENIAKSLYNFGYLPDIVKNKKIYGRIMNDSKVFV